VIRPTHPTNKQSPMRKVTKKEGKVGNSNIHFKKPNFTNAHTFKKSREKKVETLLEKRPSKLLQQYKFRS
jgi:hypothetical protein